MKYTCTYFRHFDDYRVTVNELIIIIIRVHYEVKYKVKKVICPTENNWSSFHLQAKNQSEKGE